MTHPSIEQLERQERFTSEAICAEVKQHWFQASVLWRRAGDIVSAESCEDILQHLAESNLIKLDRRRERASIKAASYNDLGWLER